MATRKSYWARGESAGVDKQMDRTAHDNMKMRATEEQKKNMTSYAPPKGQPYAKTPQNKKSGR